uniref:Uncharacterized protein n=1 Tax=Cacopsylla melanoneura TaxID=428564 RepID=A0A8D8W7A5_9HEMI
MFSLGSALLPSTTPLLGFCVNSANFYTTTFFFLSTFHVFHKRKIHPNEVWYKLHVNFALGPIRWRWCEVLCFCFSLNSGFWTTEVTASSMGICVYKVANVAIFKPQW